jgi:glycosyltransferase involved in cell wall biosynthesis
MKSKVLVSIIMPVYNSEKYLEKSIRSILNQTMKSIEVICINDCSTDGSLKKLKMLSREDGRLIIINNKKNIGPGGSRNFGLKRAIGEYVCFVDSDDWLEKNACEVLYKKAKDKNADIVYIKPKLVFEDKVILDHRLLTPKDIENKDTIFRKNLLRKVAWAPWSKFIKRDLIIKNRIVFPDIHIAEDMDFSYKTIYYAKKITHTEAYLYNYYLREDSLMSFTNPKRRIENYFESIKLLRVFLKGKGLWKKYRKEFVYFKLYTYLAIYGVLFHSKEKINKLKYKNIIKSDIDFGFIKIINLGIFNEVIIGSLFIKLHLFYPAFKIREFFRILFGKWGRRAA